MLSGVSGPEKTYIALDTINSTRKKVSAISLPRMFIPILMPVLTLCDDGLGLDSGDLLCVKHCCYFS